MYINIQLQLWDNDPLWVIENPKTLSIGKMESKKERNKEKGKNEIS
jgi:hypothetical protein